jgi:hypothetical protein
MKWLSEKAGKTRKPLAHSLPSGDAPFERNSLRKSRLPEYLHFLCESKVDWTQNNEEFLTEDVICSKKKADSVMRMVKRHMFRHPKVPVLTDDELIFSNGEEIHAQAVWELLTISKGNPRLFQYLWENWYRPGRWELWALSVRGLC